MNSQLFECQILNDPDFEGLGLAIDIVICPNHSKSGKNKMAAILVGFQMVVGLGFGCLSKS